MRTSSPLRPALPLWEVQGSAASAGAMLAPRGGPRGYNPGYPGMSYYGTPPPGAGGHSGPSGEGSYMMPSPEAAAYMGYYAAMQQAQAGAYYQQQQQQQAAMYPRRASGFFPGGKNWAGARPPPPGQPGFSSGLQVSKGAGAPCSVPACNASHIPCGPHRACRRADVALVRTPAL